VNRENHGVVPFERRLCDRALDTLSAAFFDDPMSRYVLPDQAERLAVSRALLGAPIRYGELYGAVDVVDDAAGIAGWVRPRYTKMNLWRLARSGMLWSAWRLARPARRRFRRFIDHLEKVRSQADDEPYWYLFVLAVHPGHQRRGLGDALLEHGFRRVDADRAACRLDTTNPANVAYYRRHGFEVTGEIDVPDGGPHVWTMARPPIPNP
jgi:ribosomal protein S18 acetylase RimI-like enzyme